MREEFRFRFAHFFSSENKRQNQVQGYLKPNPKLYRIDWRNNLKVFVGNSTAKNGKQHGVVDLLHHGAAALLLLVDKSLPELTILLLGGLEQGLEFNKLGLEILYTCQLIYPLLSSLYSWTGGGQQDEMAVPWWWRCNTAEECRDMHPMEIGIILSSQ